MALNRLTSEEYQNLKFQFETSKHGGVRKNPYIFTEQGVAMLASVLKSNVATQVSIAIMDDFVIMRKYISNELIEQKYINDLVIKHDQDIKLLQTSLNYAGSKTFSINKLEKKIVNDNLIEYVLMIIEKYSVVL